MGDPSVWAIKIAAEWAVISETPFSFIGAWLAAALLAWGFWWAWFRHQLSNARSDAASADRRAEGWKEKYETDHGRLSALEASLAKEKPIADIQAREIATGRQELRTTVDELAKGRIFNTPVDPRSDPAVWATVAVPLNFAKMAALGSTSSNGISVTIVATGGGYETYGTDRAREIKLIADEITRRLDEKDKSKGS